MADFYIIRTKYYTYGFLYGMTDTLYEAYRFIHNEGIYCSDTVIECCTGTFPGDYDIYKTIFVKGVEK